MTKIDCTSEKKDISEKVKELEMKLEQANRLCRQIESIYHEERLDILTDDAALLSVSYRANAAQLSDVIAVIRKHQLRMLLQYPMDVVNEVFKALSMPYVELPKNKETAND